MTKKLLETIGIVALITQLGVFDEDGERVAVGASLKLDTPDGKLPTYLVGKATIVSVDGEPVVKDVPVHNPKKEKKDDKPFEDADLTQIDGIGPATAKKLVEAGISGVKALSEASDDALLELPENMLDKAEAWKTAAAALIEAQAET